MYARSVDDETWARSVTRSRFVDVSLPIEPRGRFTKRHTRRTLTIFCSSTRNARTMRSRTAPADMTPPYARETLFLFLAMCLRLYFCVAQRGTCRTKRTNAKETVSHRTHASRTLSRARRSSERARAPIRASLKALVRNLTLDASRATESLARARDVRSRGRTSRTIFYDASLRVSLDVPRECARHRPTPAARPSSSSSRTRSRARRPEGASS